MIERLAASGSGAPTAYIGDRALHSRYNPAGEAEKYANTLHIGNAVEFFILVEPGLGYLIPVLHRRYPGITIIALHVSRFLAEQQGKLNPEIPRWFPGDGKTLQEFLEQEIPDCGAASIRIIEWRPALDIFGEAYRNVFAEAVEFIKRGDANTRTVRSFGRRWFRNFFRNIGRIERVLPYPPSPAGDIPWIITGAGPSLEEAIPAIKKFREAEPHLILGVSSSVPALRAGGIEPDMVISTDGGSWALLHLYETLRTETPNFVLAASLGAALPSQCTAIPILPIADGSLWQELILENLHIPHAALPQRGTVTASALDLALKLTGGTITFTGVDLTERDIRTHAQPYSFDRLQEAGALRFSPRYAQAFERAAAMKASLSNSIYAQWFSRQLAAYPKRLRSLGNNNAVFDGLAGEGDTVGPIKPGPGNSGIFGNATPFDAVQTINPAGQVTRAVETLIHYLNGPEVSSRLCRELAPLLLTDTAVESSAKGSAAKPCVKPQAEALIEAITALTAPYVGRDNIHG
ncbi:hypothetical protein FACS189483_07630 [Spirochaetia bacterium]|nr:hypothetical protein FACS189483_07630 [Spirochaetia bacterium]